MIEFLQDYRGVLTNEVFYRKGDQVELSTEQKLVDAGRAKWLNQFKPDYTYEETLSLYDVDELRELAKEKGIKFNKRTSRETLIKRLTDGNN